MKPSIGILLAFSVAGSLGAQTRLTVLADRVNLRSAPLANAEIVGQVSSNNVLTETGVSTGEWARVYAPAHVDLWVHRDLIWEGRVGAKIVQIRSGPGISYRAVGRLPHGAPIDQRGEAGDWLRIAPPPDACVWVHRRYVAAVPSPASGTAATPVPAAAVPDPPSGPPAVPPPPLPAPNPPAAEPATIAPAIPPAPIPLPPPLEAPPPPVTPKPVQPPDVPAFISKPVISPPPVPPPVEIQPPPVTPKPVQPPDVPAFTSKPVMTPPPAPPPVEIQPSQVTPKPVQPPAAPVLASEPVVPPPSPVLPPLNGMRLTRPPRAEQPPARGAELPSHMRSKLMTSREQGLPITCQGTLRPAGIFWRTPSRFRLDERDANGRNTTVCTIVSPPRGLSDHVGQRVSVTGRAYWIQNCRGPVVVPTSVTPSPAPEP